MATAMVKTDHEWTRDEIDLIKRTVAKGTTDDEFKLFLYQAARAGLNPLARQIHAIKRWDSREKREVMAIQTGIDGYRLIADRTGCYAPGREPSFTERESKLVSATAYVKKLVGGTWHEVAATAYYDEYVQKNKEGNPSGLWAKMPHGQLAKCAEALALRRAFPAEMSGVYVREEMEQASEVVDAESAVHVDEPTRPTPAPDPARPAAAPAPTPTAPATITKAQAAALVEAIEASCLPMEEAKALVQKVSGVDSIAKLTADKLPALFSAFAAVGAPTKSEPEKPFEPDASDTGWLDSKPAEPAQPAAAANGAIPPCPRCKKAKPVIRDKFKPGFFKCWDKAREPGCGLSWNPAQASAADEPGAAEAAELFTDGARR